MKHYTPPRRRTDRPRDDPYTRYARCRTRPDPNRPSRQLRTDGGRTDSLPAPGDRARDLDDRQRGEVIVVETYPDTAARDYPIPECDGKTVAELNQDYPARSPVVEAVYVDELERVAVDSPDVGELRAAVRAEVVAAYSFPAARLSIVERNGPGGWKLA